MARRRSNGRFAATGTRSGGEIVVVNANPPARRSGGGGISRRRRRSRGRSRHRSSGGGGGRSIQSRILGVTVGGFVYGILIKNFPQIPRLPILGRSGTIAAAGYFLKPTNQIIQDTCIAAAAIAGASFGEKGEVSGTADEDDMLASQA